MKFSNNTKTLTFTDITLTFNLRDGDSICDVAGGQNFILVLTKSGKLYGLGKTLRVHFA